MSSPASPFPGHSPVSALLYRAQSCSISVQRTGQRKDLGLGPQAEGWETKTALPGVDPTPTSAGAGGSLECSWGLLRDARTLREGQSRAAPELQSSSHTWTQRCRPEPNLAPLSLTPMALAATGPIPRRTNWSWSSQLFTLDQPVSGLPCISDAWRGPSSLIASPTKLLSVIIMKYR